MLGRRRLAKDDVILCGLEIFYNNCGKTTSGKLHRAKGHLVEALSAYVMSSSIDPDKAGPSMATVLFGLGPRAQPVARSLLMNALRVDPTCHVAWLGLGHIYKKEGLLTQAADCFQAALELFASSPLEGFR